jgi:dTDP-L-rhamnose 4-epimerase
MMVRHQPTRNGKHGLVLITGGAGFIGSHLTDELLAAGYRVRILDALLPQVHGPDRQPPDYLDPRAELIVGDVRDVEAVRSALEGVQYVCHLAAAVGVGQSMYEIADYVSVNTHATAVLLEELIERPIERLLVASSMSLYGEGLYRAPDGELITNASRTLEHMRQGDWEVHGRDGSILEPMPTPESKPPNLTSVYALTKYDQEQLCLITGRAYNIPTVALRLFNVFGTRQSLSNPYTGVLAIFLSRLLNGNPPLIYEDGLQQRDFVSVHDIARAFHLALGAPAERVRDQVISIGTGRRYSVLEIAQHVAQVVGRAEIEPVIASKYRAGDIRHCFADISKARDLLGYEPQISLEHGLEEIVAWLADEKPTDRVEQAHAELAARGLTV